VHTAHKHCTIHIYTQCININNRTYTVLREFISELVLIAIIQYMKFCVNSLTFSHQTTSVFTARDFVGRGKNPSVQKRTFFNLSFFDSTSHLQLRHFAPLSHVSKYMYTITLNENFMYASPAFSAGP
jgi:hypothetical protein